MGKGCWRDFVAPAVAEDGKEMVLVYYCKHTQKQLRLNCGQDEHLTHEAVNKLFAALFPICLGCTQRPHSDCNVGNTQKN